MTEWRYVKRNISLADIEAFEKEVAVRLPQELQLFFLEHNNGRPRPNRFDSPQSTGRILDKLLSFNQVDSENVFLTQAALGRSLPDNLVAVALDPFGNYICLDKKTLLVVFWEHEKSLCEPTGKNFMELLAELY